jgi:hypothetical protein
MVNYGVSLGLKSISLALLLLLSTLGSFSQYSPEHISNSNIYDFLDELASERIIDINTAVKPWSKDLITQKLLQARDSSSRLSKRQISEIEFYLSDYSIEQQKLPESRLRLYKKQNSSLTLLSPAFTYVDSVFRCSLSPIVGMNILNNENGTIIQRRYGADFRSAIGSHVSIFASLRDISQEGELLSMPEGNRYVKDPLTGKFTYGNFPEQKVNTPGGSYKIYNGINTGGDYSEMRGGIVISNKFGSVGLVKDHMSWGDNYNGSNILSGRTPSFPMLMLKLKPAHWVEFNYVHAWLMSKVIDSTDFYMDNMGNREYRYRNKYMAANFVTLTPIKGLNFSFGNSIIYSEKNIQPAYLIPLMFYKSIDHTLTMGTENQNSQLFFNLSSRNIRHLHLYSSVFIDEFSIKRIKKSNPEQNPYSVKAGFRLSNFPVQNLSVIAEYTRTNMLVYKHSIPSLTFTSNGYNLGHYLGDNSREYYGAIIYKPLRGLQAKLSYLNAVHGNEYTYIRSSSPNDGVLSVISQKFLKTTTWSNETLSLDIQYEIIPHAVATVSYQIRSIKGYTQSGTSTLSETITSAQGYLNMFTPTYLQGNTNTISLGFNFLF